jgi:hypothetical protein
MRRETQSARIRVIGEPTSLENGGCDSQVDRGNNKNAAAMIRFL